jgi:hypothetical protein
MHKKRLIGIVITAATLFGIVAAALALAISRDVGKRMTAEERRDELVLPLMNAKEVKLAFHERSQEVWVRTLSKPDRDALIDFLDDAGAYPNSRKRDTVGIISMIDDEGVTTEWPLYHVSRSELIFSTSPTRYWRGVRTADISKLRASQP